MNINKILELCDSISSQFSLHNWYNDDFTLKEEDKNEIEEYLHNIRKICEDTKDEVTFTVKEIEILKNERLNKYCISVGALIDYIKNEDGDGWMFEKVKNWNMTYSELQEFKLKLERLMP